MYLLMVDCDFEIIMFVNFIILMFGILLVDVFDDCKILFVYCIDVFDF